MTIIELQPLTTARFNGSERNVMVDSGAFFSMMSAASAAELKLPLKPAPYGLHVTGVGGEISPQVATVKVFTLAGVDVRNVEFLVGGSEIGGGIGVLGQNILRIADVEYDFAKGAIRLIKVDGCKNARLAYWLPPESHDYSVMDIGYTTALKPATTGVAYLNGAKIHITFDTGASTSVLSVHAAERAGIKTDSPGVVDAGITHGIGRRGVKTWIAPFATFRIGDEEVRNTHLRIGDIGIETDMLLGADFFLSHRVFVVNSQHKLFFTYNGGPVFNLRVGTSGKSAPGGSGASAAPDATATAPDAKAADAKTPDAKTPDAKTPDAKTPDATAPDSRAPDAKASNATVSDASQPVPPQPAAAVGFKSDSAVPQDAAGFSRRGAAFASRRDFEHALADLNRACELAPAEPDYFYERGRVLLEHAEPDAAMADFDTAIGLNAAHIPALIARAELRLAKGRVPAALEDLGSADRSAAKEADARLRMAFAYERAVQPAAALTQLDLWIAAHRDDVRMVQALSTRCLARGLLAKDLSKALDDCNEAYRAVDKASNNAAWVLSRRGLVRLRLGDNDKAIADFDASIKLAPKLAWSWYGRGLATLRRGKGGDGRADLAAATALHPSIAEDYAHWGLTP